MFMWWRTRGQRDGDDEQYMYYHSNLSTVDWLSMNHLSSGGWDDVMHICILLWYVVTYKVKNVGYQVGDKSKNS